MGYLYSIHRRYQMREEYVTSDFETVKKIVKWFSGEDLVWNTMHNSIVVGDLEIYREKELLEDNGNWFPVLISMKDGFEVSYDLLDGTKEYCSIKSSGDGKVSVKVYVKCRPFDKDKVYDGLKDIYELVRKDSSIALAARELDSLIPGLFKEDKDELFQSHYNRNVLASVRELLAKYPEN